VEVLQQFNSLSPGLHSLPVPPSGTVRIQMQPAEES
jgi:hypothetical protein